MWGQRPEAVPSRKYERKNPSRGLRSDHGISTSVNKIDQLTTRELSQRYSTPACWTMPIGIVFGTSGQDCLPELGVGFQPIPVPGTCYTQELSWLLPLSCCSSGVNALKVLSVKFRSPEVTGVLAIITLIDHRSSATLSLALPP